ncbi:MAG: Blue-light-activated protein [Pedosphaera sp.]|nr:Blue-light-activated protein [Pedosphaera sp.]
MKLPLRVLHLEDNADYSALVRSKLAAEGFAPDLLLVQTKEEFQAALEKGNFDLIIADYFLPDYDGIKAMKLALEKLPGTPILLVSGTIGEEAAIASLKAGATDYVLKHWPERLVPAVRRALREAEERKSRLLAEKTLVQKERRFRALSENSLDIVTILNQEGLFIYNSLSVVRMLGYQAEELLGQSAFSLVHPEDLERVQQDFRHCVENPELTTVSNFRVRHHDGTWRQFETICKSLLGDPEIAGVVVNSRDVTERHRIEHYNRILSTLGLKLSAAISAEEAAKVIGHAADELFGWDCCSLNLYSPDEDKIYPILSFETSHGRKQEIPKSQTDMSPTTQTRRILTQGGELILREEFEGGAGHSAGMGGKDFPTASQMFVPIRNGTRVIGILTIQSYRARAYDQRDLGALQTLADYCGGALERVRVEQALRESEGRFRQLFEHSPDAVFVEDASGEVLDANLAAAQLQGIPLEKLIGSRVADLVPLSKRERTLKEFNSMFRGESRQVEGMSLTADGREIPVEVRSTLIDYSGKVALLLHVRDLSERKHAAEALKGSEIRFHSIWENSVDGMRLTDESGTIIAVNEAFCNLVGMERKELEGKLLTATYPETENLEEKLRSYRERFKERSVERRVEQRMTFRNGKSVELERSNSFVESHGQRTLLLGLFRDITEQKRMAEQLRHSQKMDAIGQLAGGVAHDFNNILTVIQGHASLLKNFGELPELMAGSAEQIQQAAERAAGLTRQLLTFSRRQMMQPKQVDLNEVVNNMTKMLGRILGEDIKLQFHYSPVIPPVHADVGMLEQVLLNLAVNSRDAMPSGGQLIIKVWVLHVGWENASEHPERRQGKFACLSVTDTGSGIETKTLPHIFEPFFTTKAVGKGTGLGLATVYGIVRQHEGWIEVDSQIGHGTTFRVFLPCSGEAKGGPEQRAREDSPRGGAELILVVEDEETVRELVCSILKGSGYRVLEAAAGAEALGIWSEHKAGIDLLLTDIVMPDGMTGRDLAEKLQAEKPGLKAIFTSGYSSDIVGKDFVIQEGVNFIQKPYMPQKLTSLVRKCLDGK